LTALELTYSNSGLANHTYSRIVWSCTIASVHTSRSRYMNSYTIYIGSASGALEYVEIYSTWVHVSSRSRIIFFSDWHPLNL